MNMILKSLKKVLAATFLLTSIISTVAYADIIDNDTNLGAPYGNSNPGGYTYQSRGYSGDSRISSSGVYNWYKNGNYTGLKSVQAYLSDYAFTDIRAHYYAKYEDTYLWGPDLGIIDQCNAPNGWTTCPKSYNKTIKGGIFISVTHDSGNTGADAISVSYY